MLMFRYARLFATAGFFTLGLASTGAYAQFKNADVGVNPTNFEDSSGTVTSTGGFFSARAFLTKASDYDTATLTWGGPDSPQPMFFNFADTAFEYEPPGAPDLTTLHNLYPAGLYTFALSNSLPGGLTPLTVEIDYAGDAYSNTPSITNIGVLTDMNAHSAVTIDLSAYGDNPNANSSAIYFSITNVTSGKMVFATDALDPSTTEITIAANTLMPGVDYSFDLLYDNRINGTDPNGNAITQFYDSHTSGDFSTEAPVPEASTWAMLLAGFGGLAFAGFRRRRAATAL